MSNEIVSGPMKGAIDEGARIDSVLARMRELCKGASRVELIQQFKDEDIAAWPPAFSSKAVEALNLRGQGFCNVKDYGRAEKDLKRAVELAPGNGYAWCNLAGAYRGLQDDQRALDAYIRAYEADRAQHTEKSFGWMPLSVTIDAASILMNQAKYDEALQVMGRYDDNDMQKITPSWRIRMLRQYGQIYAGLGREEESLIKFKAALELEKK